MFDNPITVIGLGYVGLANALLLSKSFKVIGFDTDKKKISALKKKISPLEEFELQCALTEADSNFIPTSDKMFALSSSNCFFVCVPTDFSEMKKKFDTSIVENTVKEVLKFSKNPHIIVRSTIPIGFTEELNRTNNVRCISFCPEFLREGHAINDTLEPSRIVIGSEIVENCEHIKLIMLSMANKKNPLIVQCKPSEAEAIKLFANTYLAMRVAFFNELDSFALLKDLNAEIIIEGVSSDLRIGRGYNNPSFGYGGYCLPKDSKQLISDYLSIPQSLIGATVESNKVRKELIAKIVADSGWNSIGVYRLTMKAGSDNFRNSAIEDIIELLKNLKREIVIYEPNLKEKTFNGVIVLNDFDKFCSNVDVIIANRLDHKLKDAKVRIFSRDIFIEN